MDFKQFFCWPSNLSNEYVIDTFVNMYVAFCDLLQVWKRVWILEASCEIGVVNDILWSEIGSEFGELGGTPHQEFPGVPAGLHRGCQMTACVQTSPLLQEKSGEETSVNHRR